MITEDYVSFEVAKFLKEKGFDESTIFVYYDFLPSSLCFPNEKCKRCALDLFYYDETTQVNNKFNNSMSIPKYISGEVYSAPTLQMAMKWLREMYDIHVVPRKDFFNGTYTGMIYDGRRENVFDKEDYIALVGYETYEKACEAGIKYCLENLI